MSERLKEEQRKDRQEADEVRRQLQNQIAGHEETIGTMSETNRAWKTKY